MNFDTLRDKLLHRGNGAKAFIKWVILSCVTGLIVGAFSTLFSFCMTWATNFRTSHLWIVAFLPLAGLFIVFCYHRMKMQNDRGTNLVLATVQSEAEVPFRMAPLIFISTVLTHLFGGSAGREGAALQLGGSLGNQLGHIFHLDEKDRRTLVMCGMSAAFSALFGTPMAAALFPIEVVSVGLMYYGALLPCVLASLVASGFAAGMGIHPEAFTITHVPAFTLVTALQTGLVAILCAVVSICFCLLLHKAGSLYKKYLKNPYIRIFIAGLLIIGLSLLLGTDDYLGAGIPVIERAMKGEVVPLAFLLKMLFTALTLGAGYKGGEIVPSFFVGATFGCLVGNVIGLSPSLCAAIGLTAVFCGVTNCPVSSMLISFELFGFEGVKYCLLAVAISFVLSGYYGLYQDQRIAYSKYKAEYINRKVHH